MTDCVGILTTETVLKGFFSMYPLALRNETKLLKEERVVAMVASADGHISAPEHAALVELAGHVDIAPDRVAALVNDVVARVEAELR